MHIAWYDFRNSVSAASEALDVYFACANCTGASYPTFSHNERVIEKGSCVSVFRWTVR